MTNQIPEEDRKELEQEAFNYSDKIDLGEWRPVDKYYFAKINAAYIAGATQSSYVKNLTLGLQSAEKRVKELEDGIKWALDNPQSVFVFNELHKLLSK